MGLLNSEQWTLTFWAASSAWSGAAVFSPVPDQALTQSLPMHLHQDIDPFWLVNWPVLQRVPHFKGLVNDWEAAQSIRGLLAQH